MYKYLIFGAGKQGEALAYYLAKYCEAEDISFFEKVFTKGVIAIQKISRLLELGKQPKFCLYSFDKFDEPTINTLGRYDVVISALPHSENLVLTKASVQARANYLDLGFDENIVRKQLSSFNSEANLNKKTVLVNCGLAPGLLNTLAVWGAKETGCDTIRAYVGGNPLRTSNSFLYERSFAGLSHEYTGRTTVLENGEIKLKPVISGFEKISISRTYEAAYLNTPFFTTALELKKLGVKNAFEKTLRYPGHFHIAEALKDLGFLHDKVVKIGNLFLPPIELASVLFEENLPMAKEDLVDMALFFEKDKKAIKTITLSVTYSNILNMTAMQMATAGPAAAMAYMIAQKMIKCGSYVPEQVVDSNELLSKLTKMGFKISVT